MDDQDVSKAELQLRKFDHRDKLMRTFEVLFLFVVVGLTLSSLVQINQTSRSNHQIIKEHNAQVIEVGRENQTRLNVDLCIVSVPPQTRTPEYVHACYDDAEKLSGVKIKRYGYGF
jgi:hypothetical protein